LEIRRVGVVDVLIGLIALVPWRTTLLVALQLSILVRTFDAYLKWALPLLFVAGILFTYIRERRAEVLARRYARGSRRIRDDLSGHVPAR